VRARPCRYAAPRRMPLASRAPWSLCVLWLKSLTLRCGIVPLAVSVLWGASFLSAQSTTIRVESNALRVRAPGFRFIDGVPLIRLKDGRSVRFDFGLSVLARPGAASLARANQGCIVSYDLWEERFAVTTTVTPARSISHLTASDSEVWCLDHVTVPVTPILTGRGDEPFWVRLEFEAVDQDPLDRGDDSGFSLRGLVDRLSRPRGSRTVRGAIEAGPFRWPK
jgi:hypothetical protein